MKKFDYLIVGSGLYGSICAHELTKAGKRVLVIEKRDHIGGNIYTKNIDGIDVHMYGAHIFHTSNEKVWKYVNSFVEFEPFINSPLAFYKGETYNLPFNMFTFAKLFNVKTKEEAKKVIDEEKAKYYTDNPKNLEERALSLVGPTIYETLIKGYTAKQWGKPCNEIPAFIIDRIPIRYEYDNNYFNDTYQGIPKGGYTKLINKLLEGIEVKTNSNFFDDVSYYVKVAENIIFTGPIDEFFGFKFGSLEYRSLLYKIEKLDVEDFQGNAVINYTDYDVPYTRIIEHKHFMKDCTANKTIITKEYPQNWHHGLEPYYPVNDSKNNEIYKKSLELSKKSSHIFFGGRLGSYSYLDMDDVVKSALDFIQALGL